MVVLLHVTLSIQSSLNNIQGVTWKLYGTNGLYVLPNHHMARMYFLLLLASLNLLLCIPSNPMGLTFMVIFLDDFLYPDSLSVGATARVSPCQWTNDVNVAIQSFLSGHTHLSSPAARYVRYSKL